MLAHFHHLVVRRLAEDVVAGDDVLRAEGRPVVFTVLHVVEHPQLLQVLAALEGTVGDDHLQVAVGVLAVAVGLVELDALHVLVADEGIALQVDGLVVVVRAGVIVDTHHAAGLVDVGIVHADDADVPDVVVAVRLEQVRGVELLVVGIPRANLVHHLALAALVVLQAVCLLCVTVVVVLHAVDGEVLRRGLVDDEPSAVGLPRGRGEVALVFAVVDADAQLVAAREGIVGHADDLCGAECLPVVAATGGVLHHLHLPEVGAAREGSFADVEVERQQRVVVVGVGVLEIERLELLAVLEGVGRNHAEMGVGAPVAHQVVVYLHAVAVVVALVIAGDGRDFRGFAV